MVKFSETDVREMLERRAAQFAMGPVPSEATVHKARRRKVRNVVLASATTLAVVALLGLSLGVPRGSDRGLDSAGGGNAGAGGPASRSATSGQLRLVDYAVRDPGRPSDDGHAQTGPTITVSDVRRHAECMRSQGFDVPEPSRQPGGGWAVILGDAEARSLGFGSRSFRKAWFVTCGPLGGPLSGDMIIGGPRPKVDRFMSCMRRQGFRLPEPRRDTSGSYDIDAWQFDLTRTSIDTSTAAWNRAMFVICAPDDI
jgi:hypothetical protein